MYVENEISFKTSGIYRDEGLFDVGSPIRRDKK